MSILTDIVSKYGRSVLGVNVQYIIDDDLTVRTTGMIRIKSSHTGKYIAELIKDNLQEHGVSIDHIYGYTSDNGSNVVKAREEIENLFSAPNGHEGADAATNDVVLHDDTTNDDAIDSDQIIVDAILADEDDETILNSMLNDNDDDATPSSSHSCLMCQSQKETDPDQIQSITEQIKAIFAIAENGNGQCVVGLLCAAHTLQLAVNESIKKFEKRTGLLKKCKHICLCLRRQNILDIITSKNLPRPILNNATRWNSTFSMVSIFSINHQIFLINYPFMT